MKPQLPRVPRGVRLTLRLSLALLVSAVTARSAVVDDPAFHFANGPDLPSIYWVHLLPDGKLLVGGFNTARLNADGTRDSAFAPVAYPYGYPRPVLEPGGGFTTFGDYYDDALHVSRTFGRRFLADGTPDASFQPQFAPNTEIRNFERDSLGGYLLSGGGLPSAISQHALVRLLPDGTVDPSFSPVENFSAIAMVPLPGGEWLIAGTVFSPPLSYENVLIRMRADGTMRTRVAELGTLLSNPARTRRLVPLANGRILIGGEAPMLSVLRRNGLLDPAFQPIYGEGADDPFTSAIALLRDGRILVGAARTGSYLTHTGEWPLPDVASWPGRKLFRALPDGMIDLSFDANQPADIFAIYDLALQPDGKMLTVNGETVRRLVETPSPAVFAFGEKVVAANEGGHPFAALTVYRCGSSPRVGWVLFSTVESESSAVPGRDYHPIRVPVLFGPGDWKRTVFVPLRDDRIADGIKTVVVRLSHPDPAGTVYSVDRARIDIYDDDAP